jgi:hypothetical protein
MRFVIEIPDELVTGGATAPVAASAVVPSPGSLSGGAAPHYASGASSNGAASASDAGPAAGGSAALFARSAALAAPDALDGGAAPARAAAKRTR